MLTHEKIPAAEADSDWLMVVLHGLGDSMEGYRWMPEAIGLPWLNYLLVNAPDDYHGGYSWYDFLDNPAPGVQRSRDALFELLDAQRENGHPPGRIFQFGFSQGCLMTMEVAMRYPHQLAGCIGISGYVHEPEAALEAVGGEEKLRACWARISENFLFPLHQDFCGALLPRSKHARRHAHTNPIGRVGSAKP